MAVFSNPATFGSCMLQLLWLFNVISASERHAYENSRPDHSASATETTQPADGDA